MRTCLCNSQLGIIVWTPFPLGHLRSCLAARQETRRFKGLSLGSPQSLLFTVYTALLLLGLCVVQPLSSFLSYHAWRWFLALSVLSHGYKVSPT